MTPRLLYEVDGCEVWHGDCLDPETAPAVLQGRRVDLLHCDAPYSEKTHSGHDGAAAVATEKSRAWTRANGRTEKKIVRAEIDYSHWAAAEASSLGAIWLPRVDGWATTITDDVLAPAWASAFEASGRYVFAPLPWVELGSRVRLSGDGPSGWSCWAVVARPRTKPWSKWGTLPGAYIGPGENHQNRPERITGGKSLPMTLAFLGDYSKRGDLVLDTNLGGGTTILAARMSGRRCIGIEVSEERAELCARLLGTKREQRSLFEVANV